MENVPIMPQRAHDPDTNSLGLFAWHLAQRGPAPHLRSLGATTPLIPLRKCIYISWHKSAFPAAMGYQPCVKRGKERDMFHSQSKDFRVKQPTADCSCITSLALELHLPSLREYFTSSKIPPHLWCSAVCPPKLQRGFHSTELWILCPS